MTAQQPIRLVGGNVSPYTLKVVALLRYRRLPYAITWGQPDQATQIAQVAIPCYRAPARKRCFPSRNQTQVFEVEQDHSTSSQKRRPALCTLPVERIEIKLRKANRGIEIGEKVMALNTKPEVFMQEYIYPRQHERNGWTLNQHNPWETLTWFDELRELARANARMVATVRYPAKPVAPTREIPCRSGGLQRANSVDRRIAETHLFRSLTTLSCRRRQY